MKKSAAVRVRSGRSLSRRLKDNWQLYLLLVPVVITVIYKYGPMYGPIDTYFTSKDENGVWLSITDAESREKYGKSAGELKGQLEVYGPKLILSSYYSDVFKMEDRAIERLTDLYDYWMPYVKDTTVYPVDCVFTPDELDTIDMYRTDFENAVAEQEALWIKDGGPDDKAWEKYLKTLDRCGMSELLHVYQAAYDRYAEAK